MEKKQTLYEISKDLIGLQDLLEGLVDEEGNPRAPTEEEKETLKNWLLKSEDDFYKKFDSYCKFIKNQKLRASVADSERKLYKDELDRLSKRAKAFDNQARSLQDLLHYNMDLLKIRKVKTNLFSANIQNSQITVEPLQGASLEKVPECYLKPRELDTTAIKKALKDGILETRPDDVNLLNRYKIYVVETGEELENVRWHNNEILMIK